MAETSILRLREMANSLSLDDSLAQYSAEHRLAAVLILVIPGDTSPEIILTRRSDKLPNHAGQISFPGGTVEESDNDPCQTALREAREEIALPESDVEILGILDVTLLPSGFAVAPVLGVTESQPSLQANPGEVEEIFSIPLPLVCDLGQYRQDVLERDGNRREFYYLDYEGRYIWGATAKMLRSLALLLGQVS